MNSEPETSHEIKSPPPSPPVQKKRRKWLWIAGLLVVVLIVFLSFRGEEKKEAAKKSKTAPRATPISVVDAKEGDIGIYLSGLGTVTPVYTVNITSRVQGQITKVNYREGQLVHRGDSLIEIDARPFEAALMQAEGQLTRDQALLKEAQIDLKRYQQAFKGHAIAKQQLDDQEQIVFQDQGIVKSDQGVLANARVNLEYCHIQSPIEGKVGLRLIDAGNIVQANGTSPLVVVTQLQPITVIFNLPEDQITQVQEQLQKGNTLFVEAYDRSQQKKLATGRLLTLDNVIDPTTGTIKLKAEFSNEDQSLFPNQFVNARLLVSTEKNQVLVPLTSVQREAQGSFVYVVDQNHTVKMRKVSPGVAEGNLIAVSGVNAKEVIATDGFDKLQDGAKISLQQAQKSHEQENSSVSGNSSETASKNTSETGARATPSASPQP